MNLVIGSGPAAISAAHALLDNRQEVTIIDTGIDLESEKKRLVESFANQLPEEWSKDKIHSIKGNININAKGIPKKHLFGSDFPYRNFNHISSFSSHAIEFFLSYAKGGFSNIWGAAMLPFTKDDIKDWPISFEELKKHYDAVSTMTHLAVPEDDLTDIFPIQPGQNSKLELTQQATRLFSIFENQKNTITDVGFNWGQSRLAVKAKQNPKESGCVYCGMCMYGCPYKHIYSSAHTLDEIKSSITYQRGFLVEKIVEQDDHVRVIAHHVDSKEKKIFKGDRAFLGTGVHSTTKIILESLHRYNEEIQLINSDYFIMPNLMYSRTKGVLSERLTTLSQIFLELEDKKLSPFTMHYQIYTYNDLYIRAMHNLLGPLFFIAKPFLLPLLERLIVVQGYIHSDHSSTMMAKLTTEGNQSLYKVRGVVNSESRKLMKGMAKKLRKYHRELGFHPMTWLQRPGLPGGGCHSGV